MLWIRIAILRKRLKKKKKVLQELGEEWDTLCREYRNGGQTSDAPTDSEVEEFQDYARGLREEVATLETEIAAFQEQQQRRLRPAA